MPRPVVDVISARPAPQTAAPAIVFRLHIALSGRVHTMALRVQVQFDARRRPYDAGERARLYELFGGDEQFSRMLRPVVWSQASLIVPSFDDAIECDLTVPCTYDLEVASAKYLHALRDGHVPLTFLFTGTVFRVTDAAMCIEPVPWDIEAPFRMPATVWRSAMDQFFPGGGWVRLQTDTLDRLQRFRGECAVVSWDDAIDRLLAQAQGARV